MASEQQGSHSSGQSEEIIELQPQDKQKSDSPDLANTLVELNQTISHMGMMLGDLCRVNKQPLTNPSIGERAKNARGLRLHHQKAALLLKTTVRMTMIVVTKNINKKRATSLVKQSRLIV